MPGKETKIRRETKKRDEYPLYSPDTVAAPEKLPEYGYGRTSNQETGQVIVPMVKDLHDRINDFLADNTIQKVRKKKYRIYLRPGEQPPPGNVPIIGPRGKTYYETTERLPTQARDWLTPKVEAPPVEEQEPVPPPEPPSSPKVDLESLNQFIDGLDTDSPGRSVNKLENHLNSLDLSEDMVTGYDDAMTAIEEFRAMQRSDYGDAEEYRDARQESFEEILDMVRDFEVVGEEAEEQESLPEEPEPEIFDINDTDMSWYNGMLKNPEYYKRNKGVTFEIQYVKPVEALQMGADAKGITYSQETAPVNGKLVQRYAQLMRDGQKFPIPVIDYAKKTQEGRHRLFAARELLMDKVPVVVVKPYDADAPPPLEEEKGDYPLTIPEGYEGLKWSLDNETPEEREYTINLGENIVANVITKVSDDALRLNEMYLTPEAQWGEDPDKRESILNRKFLQAMYVRLLEEAKDMGKPYVEIRGEEFFTIGTAGKAHHQHKRIYEAAGFTLVDPKEQIWKKKVPTEEVEAPPIVDADSVEDVRSLFPTPSDVVETFPGRFAYIEDLLARMKAHQEEMRGAERMHTNTEYDQMVMNNRKKLLDKEYEKAIRMLFADTGKTEPTPEFQPPKIEEPPEKSPIVTSGLSLPEMQQINPPPKPTKVPSKLIGRDMQHPRWGVGKVTKVIGKEPSAYVYFDDGRYRWVRTDELEEPWGLGVVKSSDRIEEGGSLTMDEKDDILARIQKMREESEVKPEDKKFKTDTQEDVLGKIKYFLEKTDDDFKKSLIEKFLVGYKLLSMKGSMYRDLDKLFGVALDVNFNKQFNLEAKGPDDLSKIVFIDAVAHNLHKERIYPILDELAGISKSVGEVNRDDRMILLTVPDAKKSLQEIEGIKVIQKGIDLENSPNFWSLLEKAIKNGIHMLEDNELILLREWMYARI